MNAILEIAVIAVVVGLAALFVARRVIRALRGGRPSCCTDAGEAGPLAGQSATRPAGSLAGMYSCAEAEGTGGLGADGNPRPRPSYCAGCSGCGPRL
jgi:hypothetical protein